VRNRLLAFLVLSVGLWACPTVVFPDEGDREYVDWELPDDLYVRRECAALEDKINRHVPDREADDETLRLRRQYRVRVRPIPPQMISEAHGLCAAAQAGAISGTDWLPAIDRISRATDRLYTCGSCLTVQLLERQPIPEGLETYTLFLLPGGLADEEEEDTVRNAFAAFKAFGDAIGDQKAAIWFTSDRHRSLVEREHERAGIETPHSDYVDVLRSKTYCDRFGLSYNDGPYVVTTRRRPDLVDAGDEKVVVRLTGLPLESIVRVLNILEQDLRTERVIRKRALLFAELRERALGMAGKLADSFGQAAVFVSPASASDR